MFREPLAISLAEAAEISAKCWSEWQDLNLRIASHRLRSASIAARRRDRSALASHEKCPCFQFARLLRSRPSGVRGPVLLPPCTLHRPFGMAAPRQGLPVRLDRAPQRRAAFALTRASRRARTRSIGSCSRTRGSNVRQCRYSITSSARANTEGGMSMPSALAVLRLTTSSYFVGAWTGRSAGFSPLRMRLI